MKTLNNQRGDSPRIIKSLMGGVSLVLIATSTIAGEKSVQPAYSGSLSATETNMDLPSSYHRYYGQQVNKWKDSDRKVAKVDLDADLNLDGVISNSDPADGGAFEATPPGLQVGVGELTKVIVRVSPYRIEYDGEVVIGLELSGINRGARSGEFSSFEEEKANTGRVRVWKDADRVQLLLDSADPNKQYIEWATQFTQYPYNLPNNLPRVVYVEGVDASKRYAGDLRLLLTCAHRKVGSTPQQFAESRKSLFKSYRTTYDHVLLTVLPRPIPKDFVNNNVEGVWSTVSSPSK